MLRGGIVGLGNVARHGHVPVWLGREDVVIAAAADPREESRAALEAILPNLAWYDSAEALLARHDLDFVDICTPPAFHAAVARAALERGLHVLCEKPLVLDGDELDRLGETARARGRVLAAVHNWRFAPPISAASALVASGRIGAVRLCRWEVVRERPSAAEPLAGTANWRLDPSVSGGGILIDHGWHAFYVLPSWMPGALEAVSGRLETRTHREWPVEDTATVRLEFAGGAAAEVFLTWAGDERKNRIEIVGASGTIRIDGRTLELDTFDGRETRELAGSLSSGSHHPDWFSGVADEFIAEIADPRARGRSLAEAAVCLEAIRLTQHSSRRGAALENARELFSTHLPGSVR